MKAPHIFVGLTPRAKRLLIASALNNFGSGLVAPLLVVYVSKGLHLDFRVATTAVALTSLCAAIGGPIAGWLADVWGRRRAVYTALGLAATASTLYGLSDNPAMIFGAACLLGLGVGGNAAWFTVLAESVNAVHRGRVFGLNFMIINACLGLGGLVAGIVVMSNALDSFRMLYVINAITFVATALVFAWATRSIITESATKSKNLRDRSQNLSTFTGVFLSMLRNRALWPMIGIATLAFLFGYSQLESGVPALLVTYGNLGASELGIAFAVNTVAVILGQVFFLRFIERKSARSNLLVMSILWVFVWILIGIASSAGSTSIALIWTCAGVAVFAIGECIYSVTLPTLINAQTTDSTRGRVNGLYSLATSIGFLVGPLFAGQLLSGDGVTLFVPIMAVGCAAIAVFAVIFLPSLRVTTVSNKLREFDTEAIDDNNAV